MKDSDVEGHEVGELRFVGGALEDVRWGDYAGKTSLVTLQEFAKELDGGTYRTAPKVIQHKLPVPELTWLERLVLKNFFVYRWGETRPFNGCLDEDQFFTWWMPNFFVVELLFQLHRKRVISYEDPQCNDCLRIWKLQDLITVRDLLFLKTQ